MRVTFEFFGVLERLAGAPACDVELAAPGATVADALAALARHRPELAASLERSACAVGDVLVRRTDPVPAGAPIALLPPVAGG